MKQTFAKNIIFFSEMYGSCTQSDNFGCLREGQYGIIPSVMSGRIRSFEKFSFRFGRVEVRARMPVGDWMWPGWFGFEFVKFCDYQ